MILKSDCLSSWSSFSENERKGKILLHSTPLRIATIAGSYKDILHIENSNLGISSYFKNVYDGIGNFSGIKISSTGTSLDKENIQISEPIIESNVSKIYKIDITGINSLEEEYDAKNGLSIMLNYEDTGSGLELEKNITIKMDEIFKNSSLEIDEQFFCKIYFHSFNQGTDYVTCNINFLYKNKYSEHFSIAINNGYTMYTKSYLIIIEDSDNTSIEAYEVINA